MLGAYHTGSTPTRGRHSPSGPVTPLFSRRASRVLSSTTAVVSTIPLVTAIPVVAAVALLSAVATPFAPVAVSVAILGICATITAFGRSAGTAVLFEQTACDVSRFTAALFEQLTCDVSRVTILPPARSSVTASG